MVEALNIWGGRAFGRCALAVVMEHLRQLLGCAEHVRHAVEVVCHRREADFTL